MGLRKRGAPVRNRLAFACRLHDELHKAVA